MKKISKIRLFLLIFLLIFAFCGIFIICSSLWIANNYDNVTMNEILFHLYLPTSGVDSYFIKSFSLGAIFPSIILFIIVIFVVFRIHIFISIVLSISICVFCVSLLNYEFGLFKFINIKSSSFIEDNYKKIDLENFKNKYKDLQNKRNLILILLESMETTYSTKNLQNAKNSTPDIDPTQKANLNITSFGELIPNLSNLAVENVNFSNTSGFGGIVQSANTDFTIAAIVGYMCGIPLNFDIRHKIFKSFKEDYFLNSATCISDILHTLNYNNLMLMGSSKYFTSKDKFFNSHHINVKDLFYYKEAKLVQRENYNIDFGWGFEDSKLFEFAKDELKTLSKQKEPFALYLLTTDTHFPTGFIDDKCRKKINLNSNYTDRENKAYQNAIACSDIIVSDFIAWLKKQDFYENTTIIVLGDHLTMKVGMVDNIQNRFIYNAFINPEFSKKLDKKLLKNRKLNHFDVTTLILDSLGYETRRFALGINPLYDKTLMEIYGESEFSELITHKSSFYDSLWEVNP